MAEINEVEDSKEDIKSKPDKKEEKKRKKAEKKEAKRQKKLEKRQESFILKNWKVLVNSFLLIKSLFQMLILQAQF